MEFLKFRDVRWKGPEKRNKPDVVATTAKHPDSRRQISRYGKGTCAVSHFGENLLPAAVSEPAVAICLNSLMNPFWEQHFSFEEQNLAFETTVNPFWEQNIPFEEQNLAFETQMSLFWKQNIPFKEQILFLKTRMRCRWFRMKYKCLLMKLTANTMTRAWLQCCILVQLKLQSAIKSPDRSHCIQISRSHNSTFTKKVHLR